MGSGGPNESDSHQLARIGEKKIFHELDVHHVYKEGMKRFWADGRGRSMSQTFLGSGGRNESKSHQPARIDEKKIFHKLDVYHV